MSKRCGCGFQTGDRVMMLSALTKGDGTTLGTVYGRVESWNGGCHIAVWDRIGTVTPLPNPNVYPEKTE